MKKWIEDLGRKSLGAGKYSQSGQDELLEIIFSNLGPLGPAPFCVEFGFDAPHLTQGTGSNVARLVLEKQWRALLLDAENENPEINLHRHRLDAANICSIFRQYDVPKEPAYISIDVDSTDLWLFEAVVKEYRALVFSVEYNSHFPLEAAITFPNDCRERWEGDRGYGASLKALDLVARKHGYSLLWVVPRLDAFFIRTDLIDDGSDQLCFPFKRWRKCTGRIFHPPLRNPARAEIFLDYQVYESTGGDLAASRRRADPVCWKYLCRRYVTVLDWLKAVLPARVKSLLQRMTRYR
jgi:hypothetical protein